MKGSVGSRFTLSSETRPAVVRHILDYRLYRQPRLFARFLSILSTSGKKGVPEKARRTARDVVYCLCECYYRGKPASVSDIFLAAEVAKTTAIRCVALLEKLGIVTRKADPRDRRRAAIAFTTPYQDLLETFVGEVFNDFKDVIDVGSAVERRRAEEALRRSEQRFRDFAEVASHWQWETDSNLRLTWISEGYAKTTGDPLERVLGKRREELMPPETRDTEPFRRYLDLTARREPFHDIPLRWRSLKGRVHHMVVSGKPVFDASGRFEGYRGTTRDVTDLLEAQERATTAERRFIAAVEAIPDTFAIVDANDRLVMFNSALAKAYPGIHPGMSMEDFARITTRTAIGGNDPRQAESLLQARLDYHRNPQGFFVRYRADGSLRLIRERRLPDGSTLMLGSDITAMKEAQTRAADAERRFMDAIEAVSDAFALFDPDDRLVICNREYRSCSPLMDKIAVPGAAFEDILRISVEAGMLPDAVGREEEYIQERLRRHRNPNPTEPFTERISAGRSRQYREQRLPDGSTLLVATNITELQAAEERAAADRLRLREAIEAIADGFVLFDAEDRLILCNSKYRESLEAIDDRLRPGVTLTAIIEGLLDTGYYADVTPQNRAVFLAKRMKEHRQRPCSIVQHVTGDRWYEIIEYRTNDGGTLLIRHDITEQRRTALHLQRLAEAVESAAEFFSFYDADDRLVFCNKKVHEINRASSETLTPGTPFETHIRALVAKGLAPEASGREEEWIQARLERHRNPGEPFEVQRQDGIWLLIHEQRLPDGGTATLATDITRLKHTEAALRDAKEQAEFANRSKTIFLANLSHEFRTPLNSIIGFADILKNEALGSLGSRRYQEYARDISDSSRHLLDLINDIIDLSRVEASGELPLREQIVDVGDVVDSCRRLVGGLVDEAGLELKIEVLASMPGLYADERRVKQILLNLLSNAIKFTPKGGTVRLSAATQTDNAMVFQVSDNGPGIPPEDIGAVLIPFGATASNRTYRSEGSGLGLAIAKSLAEMHGATMRMESALGTGTTVTVRFPKERVVPRPH